MESPGSLNRPQLLLQDRIVAKGVDATALCQHGAEGILVQAHFPRLSEIRRVGEQQEDGLDDGIAARVGAREAQLVPQGVGSSAQV